LLKVQIVSLTVSVKSGYVIEAYVQIKGGKRCHHY